jgi:hypothetical protein
MGMLRPEGTGTKETEMNLRRVSGTLVVLLLTTLTAARSVSAASSQTEPKYQIAMAVVGDDRWFAIRYDVTTGKTWRMVEDKWEAMPDPAPLPAGHYEVHVLPLKNDWGGLRLEVISGRAWQARESAWVEINAPTEAPPAKTEAPPAKKDAK